MGGGGGGEGPGGCLQEIRRMGAKYFFFGAERPTKICIRKAHDTFKFLRHVMRAIVPRRPKCSHTLRTQSIRKVEDRLFHIFSWGFLQKRCGIHKKIRGNPQEKMWKELSQHFLWIASSG